MGLPGLPDNGLVFILIGLQLRDVADGLGGRRPPELVFAALAIVATVVIVRVIWVFPPRTCLA